MGQAQAPFVGGASIAPRRRRAELESIRELIRKADSAEAKPVVRAHLKDLTARITKALDPRAAGEGQ